MEVSAEYEDAQFMSYSGTDTIHINVRQAAKLAYDNAALPKIAVQGDTITLSINVMNTGKTALSNVTVRCKIDGLAAGVDRLSECARDAGERQSRLLSEFISDAEPILSDLSGVRDLFAALSERTAELERKTAEAESEREKLMALNRAAVEMLKEVFTAARLPGTSKEELSAIYRRALDAVAGDGEATP